MTGRHEEYLKVLQLACKYNPLEVKEVLGSLFPKDIDPKDYFTYASKDSEHDD